MTDKTRLIAFCCTWCGYAAADQAGQQRLACPEGLRIIRVMCTGMVHPDLILEALDRGAAGVLVLG